MHFYFNEIRYFKFVLANKNSYQSFGPLQFSYQKWRFSLTFNRTETLTGIIEIARGSGAPLIFVDWLFDESFRMISPMALARARALVMSSRQLGTSAVRREVHPGYAKIKEKQKAFQVDNGLRVRPTFLVLNYWSAF